MGLGPLTQAVGLGCDRSPRWGSQEEPTVNSNCELTVATCPIRNWGTTPNRALDYTNSGRAAKTGYVSPKGASYLSPAQRAGLTVRLYSSAL